MSYWRWLSKNTKFFHMSASQRMRKNKIFSLTRDGSVFTSHQQKAEILREFFVTLIGSTSPTTCPFNLELIYPHPVPGLHALDAHLQRNQLVRRCPV